MFDETVDQELGRRSRTLFHKREKDLSSLAGNTKNVIIGPVRISRAPFSWMVIMDYGPGNVIVYFDMDGVESNGDTIPKIDRKARAACLTYMRGLMILEVLANV